MKVQVERDAFADAAAWVARALPQRPSLPVLSGMRLDATADLLTVSGFDYEVSTEIEVPARVDEAGSALVSGRLLAEITRSLPTVPVDLHADGPRVVLRCGKSEFSVPTMSLDEYPELPAVPEPCGKVGSDAFAVAVGSVAVAASRDDTLPILTGVRVEIEGEALTLAATDRYRLAVRNLRWSPRDPQVSAVVLIPARTLADVAKAMTSGAEIDVILSTGATGGGMAGFAGAGRRSTTRLLDGDFPKYRSLLPTETAATAQLQTVPLTDAVKRVALVASRNTPIRLEFESNRVVLKAGGAEDAQAVETLEASYVGEPMEVAFNPGFLLDGLGALDGDETRMAFTTPTKPVVLSGKPDESDYRYLLMPVRLSG